MGDAIGFESNRSYYNLLILDSFVNSIFIFYNVPAILICECYLQLLGSEEKADIEEMDGTMPGEEIKVPPSAQTPTNRP